MPNLNPHFHGRGDHRFIGVVEDRNDPLQMGRLKIRIHGFHTSDTTLIPTADLPWAFPIMPITANGGVSGVGESVSVMLGAAVVGYWADWPDCQVPFYDGILNQIESYGNSGTSGVQTISASSSPTLNQPGNSINDQVGNSGTGTIQPSGSGPKWMQIAIGEMRKGVKAWSGSSSNPEVLKYGKDFGFSSDSTAWCSAFVHWCLKQAGCDQSGVNGLALSHLKSACYETLQTPILGCIAIYHRGGQNSGLGHAAFWMGRDGGRDKILGGDQSDAVTVTTHGIGVLGGYRWPKGQPKEGASSVGSNAVGV